MKLSTFFPFLNWAKNYDKSWLKGDISAGLTVGILLIPQGITYALIAGLPPIYGLYASMLPQFIYAFFGTSRQLSMGPIATDSLIVAAGIGAIATAGSQNYIELAILLAFFVGVIQLFFGFFKLGFLVNFLSKPVISGFTSAAAILIGISQVKSLLGIHLNNSVVYNSKFEEISNNLHLINYPTFIMGTISIIALFILKFFFKKISPALLVVFVAILLMQFTSLNSFQIDIVGNIPQGLPAFKIPSIDFDTIRRMTPIAFSLALIAFTESISVAKAIEAKHDNYKIDANKELVALGFGNMIGSLFQSYPTTGGFSRTAVNNESGANTPFAAIISSMVVGLTLLYFTPLFHNLPITVLAAIIIVSVIGLIDYKEVMFLWKSHKTDFYLLLVTFFVTLVFGIEKGILAGVILSLAIIIYKTTKPHVAVLANVPNTHFYRNIDRFNDLIPHEDIMIFRFDSQIYFANATYFKDKLNEYVLRRKNKIKLIIIDGESINGIDSTGLHMLKEEILKFKSMGISIAFSSIKGPVRDAFKRSGIINEISYENCFMDIHDAVKAYEEKITNKEIEKKYFSYINQSNS